MASKGQSTFLLEPRRRNSSHIFPSGNDSPSKKILAKIFRRRIISHGCFLFLMKHFFPPGRGTALSQGLHPQFLKSVELHRVEARLLWSNERQQHPIPTSF